MHIKLKESYGNEFLTTMKGNIVRKTDWVKLDDGDKELEHLLSTGVFLVSEDVDIVKEEKKIEVKGEEVKLTHQEKQDKAPIGKGLKSNMLFGDDEHEQISNGY